MWTILQSQSTTPVTTANNLILVPGAWEAPVTYEIPTWWQGELINNAAPAWRKCVDDLIPTGNTTNAANAVRFLNISIPPILDSTGKPIYFYLSFGVPGNLLSYSNSHLILLSGHQEYNLQINHQPIYFTAVINNGLKDDCPLTVDIIVSTADGIITTL